MMEVEQARALIERFGTERMEALEAARTALRRASGLQKIIDGYVEMFPELRELARRVTDVEQDAPKGAEALLQIMQTRPGVPWLVTDLVEEMRQRDWLPTSANPANALRTALDRLAASPETDVHKDRLYIQSSWKVVYIYDPDRPRPDPADEEPF